MCHLPSRLLTIENRYFCILLSIWKQCDQMARLFVQIFGHFTTKYLLNSTKSYQSYQIFFQVIGYYLNCPSGVKFSQIWSHCKVHSSNFLRIPIALKFWCRQSVFSMILWNLHNRLLLLINCFCKIIISVELATSCHLMCTTFNWMRRFDKIREKQL